jgi:hypothetical protein
VANQIRRDENQFFKVTPSTVVCSLHFTKENVEYHPFSGRRTKLPGSIPTVFDCWKNLKHIHKENKTRPPNIVQKSRSNSNIQAKESAPHSHVSNDESCVVQDENNNVYVSCNEAGVLAEDSIIENHFLNEDLDKLKEKYRKLSTENRKLKNENDDLKSVITSLKFSINNLNDKDINFYTGFASRAVFDAVLTFLNPGGQGENIIMNTGNTTDESEETNANVKGGRPRKLFPANQFLMFLCRVKVGLFEHDLACRFRVSISTGSNILITWSNFCYLRLGCLNIWPSKKLVLKYMPPSFKDKYPSQESL